MANRIVSPGARRDLLEISVDLSHHASAAVSRAVLARI